MVDVLTGDVGTPPLTEGSESITIDTELASVALAACGAGTSGLPMAHCPTCCGVACSCQNETERNGDSHILDASDCLTGFALGFGVRS